MIHAILLIVMSLVFLTIALWVVVKISVRGDDYQKINREAFETLFAPLKGHLITGRTALDIIAQYQKWEEKMKANEPASYELALTWNLIRQAMGDKWGNYEMFMECPAKDHMSVGIKPGKPRDWEYDKNFNYIKELECAKTTQKSSVSSTDPDQCPQSKTTPSEDTTNSSSPSPDCPAQPKSPQSCSQAQNASPNTPTMG